MDKNVKFKYSELDAKAQCDIEYNGMTFTGLAHCHPDDLDYASERTGCYIAETRAIIKVLTFQRDYEIKPVLTALKHLYSNMRTSKHYNPKSYEAKMLRSQIRVYENDLVAVSNDLASERKNLKDYLAGKDKIFAKLRAKSK